MRPRILLGILHYLKEAILKCKVWPSCFKIHVGKYLPGTTMIACRGADIALNLPRVFNSSRRAAAVSPLCRFPRSTTYAYLLIMYAMV